jgi:hypothetical protein
MNSPVPLINRSLLPDQQPSAQPLARTPGERVDLAQQTQGVLKQIPQAGLDSETVKSLTTLVHSGALSADQLKSLGTLLSQLDPSKRQEVVLPSGMTVSQAREMLKSLTEEALNPCEINQGRHAGCSVMSGLFVLANQDKGRFFTMGVELASKGRATLANGEVIQINKDSFEIPANLTENQGRFKNLSMSERVMMAALMDYGNGAAKYNFQTDRTTGMTVNGQEIAGFSGLYQHQYLKVMSGLFGGGYQVETDQQKAKAFLSQNDGKNAKGTLVDIKWSSTGAHANHMVVFMGFDSDGRVLIHNPWGTDNAGAVEGPKSRKILGSGMESLSAEDFFSRINGIVVKDDTRPALTADRDPSLDPETQIPQFQGVLVPERVNGFDYQKLSEGERKDVQREHPGRSQEPGGERILAPQAGGVEHTPNAAPEEQENSRLAYLQRLSRYRRRDDEPTV